MSYRQKWASCSPAERLVFLARGRTPGGKKGCRLKVEHLTPLPKRCPVFGMVLTYDVVPGNKTAPPGRATLDKVDPEKGYVPGNVAVISWLANHIKSNRTAAELRCWADKVERKDVGSYPADYYYRWVADWVEEHQQLQEMLT